MPVTRVSNVRALCYCRIMAGVLPTTSFSTTNNNNKPKRGGRRPNAGRKRSKDFRFDPSHAKRPELSFNHPVHVMLRTVWGVPRLRQRAAYEAIRRTLICFLEGDGFRVVHISIQRNHLHLIVEAANKHALRRGMQRFAIRAARALNAAFEREGKVFAFRYQAKQVKTADYARNTLSYVLNNWRRHGEDERSGEMSMPFDRFSSAWAFVGWSTGKRWQPPDFGLPVSPPQTQLLTFDWQWYGLIDPFEKPGPLQEPLEPSFEVAAPRPVTAFPL
jgi:putative transposase